ncbi:choice-of-anchor B family protein [Algibacter luteus]|uniref:Choice-of-anchor B domain-containing protein n=1 Tax=Algibacter luteus TaxID=1178825 RepID=A0A1M6AYY0_9FLAO|nr:choice-of-anchor B family protein [Algibacter luteus]SHI41662.1 choice-of-anchor B domain-containing protein [Algibacter luteus]
MKILRPIYSICFICFLFFIVQSCDDEPVELPTIVDTDNDGIEDSIDNCPLIANPNQEDDDDNGVGNTCDDNDDDDDGVLDVDDNCPLVANPDQDDDDNDGIGNLCDDDYVDPNTPVAKCENGFADIYPCNGYDLIANISLSTFGASAGNDCWGWTDQTTGKEYALMATSHNTVFIDISNPYQPVYLGNLPTATTTSPWRDVKVYKDHAFIVADCSFGDPTCNDDHGMQVFDLTRLRNVANPPETFTVDTHFTEFGKAHNIVINEDSGYAYIVGANRSSTYLGGPIFINISNPKAPVAEGGFKEGGYSHDAQVVTYNGPDADYTGKEILIGSNENEVVIADVSDKANPVIISTISYNNVWYAHQGWFTEDMKYFILGDELDEIRVGTNTRTIVFDFTDLDNPVFHFDYLGPTEAIDHNGYVKNNTYFYASYRAGVRMLDISQIGNSSFTEIGYFDTYPTNNATEFNGAWNVYPYFSSGNIIISDIDRGLFIIRKSD